MQKRKQNKKKKAHALSRLWLCKITYSESNGTGYVFIMYPKFLHLPHPRTTACPQRLSLHILSSETTEKRPQQKKKNLPRGITSDDQRVLPPTPGSARGCPPSPLHTKRPALVPPETTPPAGRALPSHTHGPPPALTPSPPFPAPHTEPLTHIPGPLTGSLPHTPPALAPGPPSPTNPQSSLTPAAPTPVPSHGGSPPPWAAGGRGGRADAPRAGQGKAGQGRTGGIPARPGAPHLQRAPAPARPAVRGPRGAARRLPRPPVRPWRVEGNKKGKSKSGRRFGAAPAQRRGLRIAGAAGAAATSAMLSPSTAVT